MNEDSREQGRMEVSKPQIIQINEGEVHAHVDRLVKQTVEEMLAMVTMLNAAHGGNVCEN